MEVEAGLLDVALLHLVVEVSFDRNWERRIDILSERKQASKQMSETTLEPRPTMGEREEGPDLAR